MRVSDTAPAAGGSGTSTVIRKLRAVAFDLDGTLVDSLPAMELSWNAVLAPVIGRPIPAEEIVSTLGPHLIDIVRRYVPEGEAQSLTAALSEHYRSVFLTSTRVYPGIRELLARLADRGLRLGVVTSMDDGAHVLLEYAGLLRFFSAVVTADDVVALKPDPEPVRGLARGLQVAPPEMVVIGDSHVDLQAARAAGARFGAALWGFSNLGSRSDADWAFAAPGEVCVLEAEA